MTTGFLRYFAIRLALPQTGQDGLMRCLRSRQRIVCLRERLLRALYGVRCPLQCRKQLIAIDGLCGWIQRDRGDDASAGHGLPEDMHRLRRVAVREVIVVAVWRLIRVACAQEPEGFPTRSWMQEDRKSTRLNSSHTVISYAVFCLKKKKKRVIVTLVDVSAE